MRFVWLIFGGLVLVMLGLLPRLKSAPGKPAAPAAAGTPVGRLTSQAVLTATPQAKVLASSASRRDSVVRYGLQQLGSIYTYAGTTPETGFDCSGFVQYVFARFGVPVAHSTAMLIDAGQFVPRSEALPGDIVVFTGTAPTATTPGHAGIVVSLAPMRFVHSSSARRESGVKVSQVEGTDYERRFMQVRRVLLPGRAVAAVPAKKAPASPAVPVAPLRARPVAVATTAAAVAPPAKLKAPVKRGAKKPTARRAARKSAPVAAKRKPVKKAPARKRTAANRR